MQINEQALLAQHPKLADVIRRASEQLVDVLGASADLVKADWASGVDDRGRQLIDLRISDWTGSVSYQFAPEELKNSAHMKIRLHRLWGDLLMVQFHVHLDQMNWQLQTPEGH